jgi:hypothetical protein
MTGKAARLGFAAAFGLSSSGTLAAPAAGAPPSLPTKPFFAMVEVANGQTKAAGPGSAGTLGVTSLIITNANLDQQTLFIFAPVIGGGSCSATVNGGGEPSMTVFVPPRQTVQFTFPTPLVFAKINGSSCIAVEVTTVQNAALDVAISGFFQ